MAANIWLLLNKFIRKIDAAAAKLVMLGYFCGRFIVAVLAKEFVGLIL